MSCVLQILPVLPCHMYPVDVVMYDCPCHMYHNCVSFMSYVAMSVSTMCSMQYTALFSVSYLCCYGSAISIAVIGLWFCHI